MNFYQRCIHQLAWLQFDDGVRTEMYRSLTLFLKNQVQLSEAIRNMIQIYGGNNPYCQHPMVHALRETLENMNNGMNFSESLRRWVPPEEALMLASGESSGRLADTFTLAIELIESKSKIKGAIVGAAAYPALLITLSCVLLYIVATTVVPKLAQMVSPDRWTGSALWLYRISNFTIDYGLIALFFLVISGLVIAITLPWRGGKIRIWLDNLPPWNIYKMVQGASFLMNISSMIQSGQQIDLALKEMEALGTPWMRERLQGIRRELAKGKNFGRALCDAGYGFPDQEANQFLAVVSDYSGSEKAMADVGKRWLATSISRVETISNLLSAFGLCIVGGVMVLVVMGASGMQEALQKNTAS